LTFRGFYAKRWRAMRPEALQTVTLAVAHEREIERVLDRIVRTVAGQEGVALARVWLIDDGDVCEVCPMRAECPDHARCLHLVASAGTPGDPGESWARLDGGFRRFRSAYGRSVGSGRRARTLLHDMTERSA
jgi:hypothetical protein